MKRLFQQYKASTSSSIRRQLKKLDGDRIANSGGVATSKRADCLLVREEVEVYSVTSVVGALGKAQISDGSGLRHVETSFGTFELSMSNNLSN